MSVDPGNCITWQRAINRIEGVAGLQSLRSSPWTQEEKKEKETRDKNRNKNGEKGKKGGEKKVYTIRREKRRLAEDRER